MKTISLKIILFIFLLSSITSANASDKLGAGLIIGEPTGISIKYGNFSSGIAWSLENHFHFHIDYWLLNKTLTGPVNWFIGIGGKFQYFDNDNNKNKDDNDRLGVGVRVPVGLQYYIISNLELFGEIVPGLALIPGTGFDLDAGIGIRYYF